MTAPCLPGLRLLISSITVGERAREDMGDLASLACSISEQGLLQPLGVTADNELVFGERRLRACRDLLGWTEIDVRIVDVTSIAAGEEAENNVRKDFTPSERLAIAEAIRRELGLRQGARTDKLPDGGPGVRGETRDFIAKRVGFSSGKQFERAAAVVERGVPELVAKMDAGAITISAAEKVARLPEFKQREITSQEGSALAEALKKAQSAKAFRDSLPTPREAKAIARHARETGQPALAVIGKDGRFHTAATEEEIARGDTYLAAVGSLRSLRDLPCSAEEIAQSVSRQGTQTFDKVIRAAKRKLDAILEAWERLHVEAA